MDIPPSFRSRMTTFKEHIAPHVADVYDFVPLRDQAVSERQTVLVPIKFCHIPVSQVLNQQAQSNPVIPIYQPDKKDDFLSMVYVALKLRSDILAQPVHQGLNVCTEDAIACVPESLYMFIRLMLGGQSLLENGLSDGDDDDKENDDDFINDDDEVHDAEDNNRGTDDDLESNYAVDEEGEQPIRRQNARLRKQETRVLSIAQDLVYSVSGDRRWTPKHVGLGSSLHQATRSKKLVEMFHNAGHTISYLDIRRVDTALRLSNSKSIRMNKGPKGIARTGKISHARRNLA